MTFWVLNDPFAPNKNFFEKKIFHALLAPFIVQSLKKLLEPIQSYEDGPFLGPKWSVCPEQVFFGGKIINIIFIYLLNNFIVPNTKFLDPKCANLPKPKYFRKAVDKPSSNHSCLSATIQKSKSDINLLMKY